MNVDDEGTKREEEARELAQSVRKPVLPVIGVCYWCQSKCAGNFCEGENADESDCQHDYEQFQRFHR